MMKNFRRSVPTILLAFFMFGLPVLNSEAFQKQGNKHQTSESTSWVNFSPADRSFTINLPQMPSPSEKFNRGMKDETEVFRCTKSLLAAYRLPLQPGTPEVEFSMGVFDVSDCKRTSKDFKLETKNVVNLFADDDDDQIILDKNRKVNGYRGRVFITRTGAGHYVWDMFVDTGKRIYWLVYVSEETNGRSSAKASRILDSFRPTR